VIEGKHIVIKERDGWEYVERKKAKEAVAVIAVTNDGKLIFTEQYRRPVDARVIDWPAGLVGDGEETDPAKTAKKELEEETGYTCEHVELLARGPTSPGITSEIVSFYRARSVTKKGDGGGVNGEDIKVHIVDREGARGWLTAREREGVLIDVKVWAGLYFVLQSTL
jgi:ADP-ribose pyrophosphatase